MADLYVDLPGMTALSEHLRRARDDITGTIAFLHEHAALEWYEVGFLGQLATPHREAYGQVATVFSTLQRITGDAAARVDQARLAYARNDRLDAPPGDPASAAAVDATYPGARDPIALRSARFSSPPRSGDGTALFTDDSEPSRFLRDPQYLVDIEMWSINPRADLLSPAAWIRQAAVWAIGIDPFDQWASDISGDWRAYYHAGIALGQAGGVVGEIARNVQAGARDLPGGWRGRAADGFEEFQFGLAAAMFEIEKVCATYRTLYEDAARAVKTLTEGLAGLLVRLIDWAILLSGAIAAGTATIETVAGPIAGYSTAVYAAWQVRGLYKAIADVYGTAEDAIKLAKGTIETATSSLGMKTMPKLRPYEHPAD